MEARVRRCAPRAGVRVVLAGDGASEPTHVLRATGSFHRPVLPPARPARTRSPQQPMICVRGWRTSSTRRRTRWSRSIRAYARGAQRAPALPPARRLRRAVTHARPALRAARARAAQWRERELDSKLTMLGQVYGAHVPMRKRMEAQIVSRAGRLPGLPSSNLGLEVLMNTHEDIEFDDFLGEPAHAAEAIDVHLAMEKRLGMDRAAGKPPSALPASVDGSLRAHRALAHDV